MLSGDLSARLLPYPEPTVVASGMSSNAISPENHDQLIGLRSRYVLVNYSIGRRPAGRFLEKRLGSMSSSTRERP